MAKKISWRDRIHSIRKTVEGSVRTDYACEHIGELFELRERQAGALLRTIATQRVNGGYLVSRQALQEFLEEVDKAEDLEAFMIERKTRVRKFPRRLTRNSIAVDDVLRLTCDQLPPCVTMAPGRMVVEFLTFEGLMDAWWRFASVVWNDEAEFRRRWELKRPEVVTNEKEEFLKWQFDELETAARAHGFASYREFEESRTRDWLLKREVQRATISARVRAKLEA